MSKEYSINRRVLLKHFKLVFIQLQLVNFMQIAHHLSELRKNKKGFFFLKHRVPVGFPGLMTTRARGMQCWRALSSDRCSSEMFRLQLLSSSK